MKVMYSIKEAADALGLSRQTIQKEIYAKNITACKYGNKYLIDASDLEVFRTKLRNGEFERTYNE